MSVSDVELAQLKQWITHNDNDALSAWVLEREQQANQGLFEQIGHLTRGLYDSINTLQSDSGENHSEQARDRLRFVIDRSQDSANRVLDAVDEAQPVAQRLLDSAQALSLKWNKLGARELSGAEFRELYAEMKTFLQSTEKDCNDLNSGLQSIVLAQDFQDLTGQVLERVIEMLTRVEHSLVGLMADAAEPSEATKPQAKANIEAGLGPQARVADDSVGSQADVDDLLSSLGF